MKAAAVPGTWIDYWDSETIFRPLMERTARRFAERLEAVLPLGGDDVLLDYGCGAGYLIGRLAGRVRELHGVDTSKRLISECREKYMNLAQAQFHQLNPHRWTDLAFLGSKRFSVIICLSVVQYFERLSQVEELIRALHGVAAPGARLLIADIPTGSTPVLDAADLVWAAAREGFFLKAARFLLQSAISQYARVRATQGLLVIPIPALRQVAGRLNLKAEIRKEPLTFSRRRVHLLVSYA